MLAIDTKVFADNNMNENKRLVVELGHLAPDEFVQIFRDNIRQNDRTPFKRGGLRRNIRSQVLGNKARVWWQVAYAGAQEAGQSRGRIYRKYSKEGTGKGFAQEALLQTSNHFTAKFYAKHPEYGSH